MTAPRLRHRSDYRALRRVAYPGAGEALDAVMKGLRAYRDGAPLPVETLAWIEECERVKTRFAKPKEAT